MPDMSNRSEPADTLFTSRVFKVVKKWITGRSGAQLERHIVVHPGAVVVLPILDDGRIVLIRQHRIAVEEDLVELPAGTLEPNEPPISTARRELIEETGYVSESVSPIMSFYSSPGFIKEEILLFQATNLIPGPTDLEDGEQIETLIVQPSEAMNMISEGKIKDAKTIIGIYWYVSRLRDGGFNA